MSLPSGAVLEWNQDGDPNGDEVEMLVELSTDEAFEEVLLAERILLTEPGQQRLEVTESLALDTTYWWRVEATDGRAPSGFATASFSVLPANRSPSETVSESPEPGAAFINDGSGVALTVVNATDPDPFDVLVYEFQVATSVTMGGTVARPFDVAAGADGRTTYVVLDLPDGQYFWRARAFDGARQGAWSDIRAFLLTAPIEADAGQDAGLDAGDSDAGDDEGGGNGGGCSAAPLGSTGTLLWWCAVLACTMLRSTRRRPMHAPPEDRAAELM